MKHILRISTIASALLLSTSFLATTAHAWESGAGTSCASSGISWTADQEWEISNVNLSGSEFITFRAAATEVAQRLNFVGGQWFDVILPMPSTTGNPSENSVNEIAMVTTLPANTLGLATVFFWTSSCEIDEVDIRINNTRTTQFGMPEDEGFDYYDTPLAFGTTDDPEDFFRPVFLHELLHGVGLGHIDNAYGYQNYGDLPWTNRVDSKKVEPLPDDREGMRALYGNSTAELDVAAVNTWFDSSDVLNGAAAQTRYCLPSTGKAFSSSMFSDTCGVTVRGFDGSSSVCPGDNLYVRYTVANYSTSSVTVDEELWFSLNDNLSVTAGLDKESVTTYSRTVPHSQSRSSSRAFRVPTTVSYNKTYYPIVRLAGASLSSEESQQNNWIPLRGKIKVKSQFACGLILK